MCFACGLIFELLCLNVSDCLFGYAYPEFFCLVLLVRVALRDLICVLLVI